MQRTAPPHRDGEGRELAGATTEVAVDGACTRVAFVTAAPGVGVSGRAARRWPGASTPTPPAGTPQVYLHMLARTGPTARRLAGLTVLVSRAGPAPAATGAVEASLSSDGRTVAYVSTAQDLGVATGGVAQVWQTRIGLEPRVGRTAIHLRTRLVSATPSGLAGSGPSVSPSSDHDGAAVAFATLAPELAGGAGLPWQIILTRRGLPAVDASESNYDPAGPNPSPVPLPTPGNAASFDPSVSEGGLWVFFDSRATNLVLSGGRTAQREVFRWTDPSLKAYADLSGVQVKSKSGGGTGGGPYSTTPAEAPAGSARGNYLLFESEDPLLDYSALVGRPAWLQAALQARHAATVVPGLPAGELAGLPGAGGQLEPDAATQAADPRLHQVFLRYLGPR